MCVVCLNTYLIRFLEDKISKLKKHKSVKILIKLSSQTQEFITTQVTRLSTKIKKKNLPESVESIHTDMTLGTT